MTFHIRTHRVDGPESPIDELHLSVTAESLRILEQFWSTGLNSRPDVHPDLKKIGDILTHGKILQDYDAQNTYKEAVRRYIKSMP